MTFSVWWFEGLKSGRKQCTDMDEVRFTIELLRNARIPKWQIWKGTQQIGGSAQELAVDPFEGIYQ